MQTNAPRTAENDQKFYAALATYNDLYDNDQFLVATRYMTTEDANTLIDNALYLCGSPYHAYEHVTENHPSGTYFLDPYWTYYLHELDQ